MSPLLVAGLRGAAHRRFGLGRRRRIAMARRITHQLEHFRPIRGYCGSRSYWESSTTLFLDSARNNNDTWAIRVVSPTDLRGQLYGPGLRGLADTRPLERQVET